MVRQSKKNKFFCKSSCREIKMKLTRLLILFALVGVLLIGCESKNMKNAKDFIDLKDWVNAIEKLQSEIKDNPKNIEAYKLLLLAQHGLYFGGFDYSNFLDPNNANFDEFPELDKDGSKELFATMERIEKIQPNSIDAEYLFFKALYNHHEWVITVSKLLESESDMLKQIELRKNLYEKRCENAIFKEAIKNFQKCANTKSDLADNAFFWWYSIQCSTSYTTDNFINDFRRKYKNSDLNDEVDLVEFRDELKIIVNKYKNNPDSTSIEKPMEIISAFVKSHPNFKAGDEVIGNLMIDYVVGSNREYVSDKNIYKYSNADGLIEYLIALSEVAISKNINIKAPESIAEYYENTNDKSKAIEYYQKILESKLPNAKKDEIHYKIGEAFKDIKDYENAVTHYNKISKLNEMQKFSLWECFNELGNTSESQKLQQELEKSNDSTVRYLIKISSQLKDREHLKIKGLDAEFDDYTIKVKGYIVNNLTSTVRNVKIRARVSDEYGNNTKESYDYIDIIYAGKKSFFEISVYYGSNRPSSIKYGASVIDFSK